MKSLHRGSARKKASYQYHPREVMTGNSKEKMEGGSIGGVRTEPTKNQVPFSENRLRMTRQKPGTRGRRTVGGWKAGEALPVSPKRKDYTKIQKMKKGGHGTWKGVFLTGNTKFNQRLSAQEVHSDKRVKKPITVTS